MSISKVKNVRTPLLIGLSISSK